MLFRSKILWRSIWQPTPVFLPGKSHGQRNLAGYSPWGLEESVGYVLVGRGEEHRGCAGRTRRRGTCLCVSHLSQPLLPSGSERSVLMWGGPELQLLARMAGRTFPVGIMWHPQGSLITRATGQARLPPALRLLFPGDRKSVVVGKECRSRWSPYH